MTEPLSQPSPPERFTDRAADYVAGRPAYPAGVIDVLRDRLGVDAGWRVVDVGAGTGMSSELFLAAGHAVTAVEPNAAMRAAADARFASTSRYESVAAPAEATTLPGGSADLVVAAQAFHWFDRAAFAAECRRLLSPRGRVLVMTNDRATTGPALAVALEALIVRFGIDYPRVRHSWPTDADMAAWFEPAGYVRAELVNDQVQTFDALAARLASSSYLPSRDRPEFEAMHAALRRVFDAHAEHGRVTVPYRTRLYAGVPIVAPVETAASSA